MTFTTYLSSASISSMDNVLFAIVASISASSRFEQLVVKEHLLPVFANLNAWMHSRESMIYFYKASVSKYIHGLVGCIEHETVRHVKCKYSSNYFEHSLVYDDYSKGLFVKHKNIFYSPQLFINKYKFSRLNNFNSCNNTWIYI